MRSSGESRWVTVPCKCLTGLRHLCSAGIKRTEESNRKHSLLNTARKNAFGTAYIAWVEKCFAATLNRILQEMLKKWSRVGK